MLTTAISVDPHTLEVVAADSQPAPTEDDPNAISLPRREVRCHPADEPLRCHCCGTAVEPRGDAVIKRGAIVVLYKPVRIFWRGREVRLSPTEAIIFAAVVRRGRASFEQIEKEMLDYGVKPANRAVLIWRIRDKFARIGAQNPFETMVDGLRFVVESDEASSTATIIGLRLSQVMLPVDHYARR